MHKDSLMKSLSFFITVFLLINCSIDYEFLVKSKQMNFEKLNPDLKKDKFLIVEEDCDNIFYCIYEEFNFFRFNAIGITDSYRDSNYEMSGIKYKKIQACVNFTKWKRKENYLQLIFYNYRNEINKLENITVYHRRVFVHSALIKTSVNDCFILVGNVKDSKIESHEINQSEIKLPAP
jgi:hypothetical protein